MASFTIALPLLKFSRHRIKLISKALIIISVFILLLTTIRPSTNLLDFTSPITSYFQNPVAKDKNMISSSSISKVYADVLASKPQSYWDYDDLNIKWNPQENYEIIKKLGRGKYSEVFLGIDHVKGEKVVIKV